MEKIAINTGWEWTKGTLRNPLMMNMIQGWKKCSLPHDAQILTPRDPHSPTEDNEGWTQGLAAYYRKRFFLVPEAEGKQVWLELEGVAGAAEIWVNGQYVAKELNPYLSVLRDISALVRPGENTVQVHVDSRMKPNSRWYVGTGLYRQTHLYIGEKVAVLPDGFCVQTLSVSSGMASVRFSAELTGKAAQAAFSVWDGDKEIARVDAKLQDRIATAEAEIPVTPWSPEQPTLYTVRAEVKNEGITDIFSIRTGFRTVEVNPKQGLLLNGKPIKLRGGCIHHDHGILGAADHPKADRRRIRLLKQSGFNAVRGAHNPFGPAFYQACDEMGMLVIEEAFDEWVLGRTDFGSHITFEDRWERDLERMIRRDRNHPAIILWSTGNEVEERDGSADGFIWSKRLADKVKALDSTRPVSASACSLFTEYTNPRPDDGATGNQALNMAYDNFASGVDIWGDTTAAYFAPLDVAGYNYKSVRYEHDGNRFPDRVICGTESYPRAALDSWQAAERNPHVIGDFVWTAWDYIGETGVGRWEVSDYPRPSAPQWPWLLAYCGDFDLLGHKRPQSWYRDVVWQIHQAKPRIFCLPPQLTGKSIARLSWGWLPVERYYDYAGHEGEQTEAHIYADADEVELLLNGVSLGKKPCTVNEKYSAVFSFPWQPGTLTAVARKNGQEIGRDSLSTAGKVEKLLLTAESDTIIGDGEDICYIAIRAADAQDQTVYGTQEVSVTVTGGELLALGSADPKPDAVLPYSSGRCKLFQGEAMAVVRADRKAKELIVTAQAEGLEPCSCTVSIQSANKTEGLVREIVPDRMDTPIGDLLKNEKNAAALRAALGPVLDSKDAQGIMGLSLRRLFSMSGNPVPAELEQALK